MPFYPNSSTAGIKCFPAFSTNAVTIQPDSVFKTTLEGLCSQTLNVVGNYTDLISGGPFTSNFSGLTLSRARLSSNPYYANLLLFTSSVKNLKGGLGLLSLEYRGLDPVYGNTAPGPIYSLDRSTNNEPIQTHPKWITQIAGTADAPTNGSKWVSTDASGSFYNPNISGSPDTGFNANSAVFFGWIQNVNVTGNVALFSSFAGTTDYLLAGQTWTATYVSLSEPSSSDLAGVGYVAVPDGSPPTPAGYKWLYLGVRYTDQAGVFRIDKSWRMFQDNNASEITYTP